jgi:hypothetical protein
MGGAGGPLAGLPGAIATVHLPTHAGNQSNPHQSSAHSPLSGAILAPVRLP